MNAITAMASRRRFAAAPYRNALRTPDGKWTNLALMLSDQCPWRTVVKCDGEFRRSVGGPVLIQPFEVARTVMEIRSEELGGGRFPAMEFDEVLLNAASHRSYCDPSPIIVDVRKNMTVVRSPGGMMRVDTGYEGRTRNPCLASIAASMGLKNSGMAGVPGIMGSYRSS